MPRAVATIEPSKRAHICMVVSGFTHFVSTWGVRDDELFADPPRGKMVVDGCCWRLLVVDKCTPNERMEERFLYSSNYICAHATISYVQWHGGPCVCVMV